MEFLLDSDKKIAFTSSDEVRGIFPIFNLWKSELPSSRLSTSYHITSTFSDIFYKSLLLLT